MASRWYMGAGDMDTVGWLAVMVLNDSRRAADSRPLRRAPHAGAGPRVTRCGPVAFRDQLLPELQRDVLGGLGG